MSVSLVDGHIDDAPGMTDNEIIKALECCIPNNMEKCLVCPFHRECIKEDKNYLAEYALDLINRQKAEIERLTVPKELIDDDFCGVVCEFAEELIKKAKAEAIKEFAERLKDYYIKDKRYDRPNAHTMISFLFDKIDNLVKEMVGEG